MKLNLATAFTLIGALNVEIQKIWKDKEITVGEIYEVLGVIIDGLGLKDKVLFEKEDKK